MNMTKNPLALVGGVLTMIFGLSLALFLGYNVFLEEKMYRRNNESVMGIIIEKEEQKIYNEPLSAGSTKATTDTEKTDGTKPVADGTKPVADGTKPVADGTKPVADGTKPIGNKVKKSAENTKTTTPPMEEPTIRYNLHYSFTPAGATQPVTSVLTNTTKRLFGVIKENDKVEVLYMKDSPLENHRALFPYEFGQSFYLGIGALFGGALFITYLGWCFIFPED
jgi:hypothetical protein